VKKILATAGAAAMMLSLMGAGTADAAPGPDANGPAKKGLCTAYFNGSERGQEQKRKAPPFQNLEAAAEAASTSGAEGAEAVAEFCGELVGGRAGGDKGTPGRP